MAGTLGARALLDIALPTGVDGATIAAFDLEKGLTVDQALALAAQVIGDTNDEITAMYGGLWRFTTSIFARYRQGNSTRNETPDSVEFSKPDSVRGDQIGHMFPRKRYRDYISWTEEFEERADPELVRFDLQEIRDRWINKVDRQIWTRALTPTENAIGSAGYDVGWATVTSGFNVGYIPPQYMGIAFDGTHTHYRYFDDDTLSWSDAFESGMEHLRHHGHVNRNILIYISMTDLSEVAALSNFAALESPNIVVVGGNTSSPVSFARGTTDGIPGQLIGYYRSKQWGLAEIRYSPRIPTNYAFATVSYGMNAAQNPFAVRIENAGFGMSVLPDYTTTRPARVKGLEFKAKHGIAVSDRTAGVALYLNSGAASYVTPTIS